MRNKISKRLLLCIISPHGNLHSLKHKLKFGIVLLDFIQFLKFFLQMLPFLPLNKDSTKKEYNKCHSRYPEKEDDDIRLRARE